MLMYDSFLIIIDKRSNCTLSIIDVRSNFTHSYESTTIDNKYFIIIITLGAGTGM